MKTLLLSALVFLFLASQSLLAQNYSVGPLGQTDTLGGAPPLDDILGPMLPAPFPVLPGGAMVNVDAFSYNVAGPTPGTGLSPVFSFSVDHPTIGTPGTALATQAAIGPGDHQTDVFVSYGFGSMTNSLLHDGDGSSAGLGMALGLAEGAAGVPGASLDGVNGYDASPTGPPPPTAFGGVYWSVDMASLSSPSYSGMGFTESDIFVGGYAAGPMLFAAGASFGLVTGDELDALQIYDRGVLGTFDGPDIILFSLDPFSTSLAGLGVGPDDILISSLGGMPGIYEFGAGLGIAGGNVNALSVVHVPEPGCLGLLAFIGCGFMIYRRR